MYFAINGVIPENWANCISNIKTTASRNGSHFFDQSNMRFFNSRILERVFITDTKTYFVTSERFDHNSPRLYTVRYFDRLTAQIDGVGEFQAYKTSRAAYKAIEKLINA